MGIALSIICPFSPDFLGRWCFFLRFRPETMIRYFFGNTRETAPVLPLSFPAIIITLSFFLIFINLNDLRCSRGNRLKSSFRYLAWNWPEYATGDGLLLSLFQNNHGILIKSDIRAVFTAICLSLSHNHGM